MSRKRRSFKKGDRVRRLKARAGPGGAREIPGPMVGTVVRTTKKLDYVLVRVLWDSGSEAAHEARMLTPAGFEVERDNPYVGEPQPTLFGEDEGIFKPIGELTDAEIIKLPRHAFSEEEWDDDLDDEDRKAILLADPEAAERIEQLADILSSRMKWLREPDGDMVLECAEMYIYDMSGSELVARAKQIDEDQYDTLRAAYGQHDDDAFDEALGEVLGDTDNYTAEAKEYDEYSGGRYFQVSPYSDTYYIELNQDPGMDVLNLMDDDELQVAVDQAKEEEDDIPVSAADIREAMKGRYPTIEVYSDPYWAAYYDINWTEVGNNIELEEGEMPDEEPYTEVDERVIHTFDDGAYVIKLHSSELAAEGDDLGHCIADAEHGWPQKLRRGEVEIWSLRTPSGRPRFTFAVALHPPAFEKKQGLRYKHVIHVLGKANRLPGWPAKEVGTGKFKPSEVEKIIQVIQANAMSARTVADLGPALTQLELEDRGKTALERARIRRHGPGEPEQNPYGDAHCGFCGCPPRRHHASTKRR